LATVNTFAVNYRGEPFVEPLKKNKMLFRSLQVCYGVLLTCALEVFPPLNDLFQLSEFPTTAAWSYVSADTSFAVSALNEIIKSSGFPVFMCGLMICDTALAFAVERIILQIFEPSKTNRPNKNRP
jgi:magnesium-transporting ATPase (P-type)